MTILGAASSAWAAIDTAAEYDCCVYALEVLRRRYGLGDPTPELQALWMIHPLPGTRLVPLERVWGPVAAAVQVGIGVIVAAPTRPAWHLCQGWTEVQADGTVDAHVARGHTWLWRVEGPDVGLAVESSRDLGVRWHGPERWSDRVRRYPGGVAVAQLRAVRAVTR